MKNEIRKIIELWIYPTHKNGNKNKSYRKLVTSLYNGYTLFFTSNNFFNLASVLLKFSWTGLEVLLRCCLIPVTIIIMRHTLYLVYLCPCLGLGLFTSYLCDLCFIFSLIAINHITSFKQTYLLSVHFQNISHYSWMILWLKKVNNFQTAKVQPQGLA